MILCLVLSAKDSLALTWLLGQIRWSIYCAVVTAWFLQQNFQILFSTDVAQLSRLEQLGWVICCFIDFKLFAFLFWLVIWGFWLWTFGLFLTLRLLLLFLISFIALRSLWFFRLGCGDRWTPIDQFVIAMREQASIAIFAAPSFLEVLAHLILEAHNRLHRGVWNGLGILIGWTVARIGRLCAITALHFRFVHAEWLDFDVEVLGPTVFAVVRPGVVAAFGLAARARRSWTLRSGLLYLVLLLPWLIPLVVSAVVAPTILCIRSPICTMGRIVISLSHLGVPI